MRVIEMFHAAKFSAAVTPLPPPLSYSHPRSQYFHPLFQFPCSFHATHHLGGIVFVAIKFEILGAIILIKGSEI